MMENQTYPIGPSAGSSAYNTCESYVEEIRRTIQNKPVDLGYPHNILDYVLLPIICIFGILGNILNLFILSRKQINASLDRMERSVYLGLIALAVSDLFQCLFFLTIMYRIPEYVVPLTFLQNLHLFFYAYQMGLINVFLFSSTWLTVLMAVGRYVAICHPINARSFVKLKVTCFLIIGIFLVSIGVSLPYFFQFKYHDFSCIVTVSGGIAPEDCQCSMWFRVPNEDISNFLKKYNIFWIVIEFVVPLVVMVFCNAYLIISLKQSYRMQRQCRATRVRDPSQYITPTLVAVIVFFIVFIAPVEIIKVAQDYFHSIPPDRKRLVESVINIMQCQNAAVNFVLYCVINVHFRKTIRKMFCCKEGKRHVVGSMKSDQIRTNHTSVTYNMSEAETEL